MAVEIKKGAGGFLEATVTGPNARAGGIRVNLGTTDLREAARRVSSGLFGVASNEAAQILDALSKEATKRVEPRFSAQEGREDEFYADLARRLNSGDLSESDALILMETRFGENREEAQRRFDTWIRPELLGAAGGGAGVGGGGGGGAGGAGGAAIPAVEKTPEELYRERQQELSSTTTGRRQLLEEFLAGQPNYLSAFPIERRMQQRKFEPFQNLYDIGRTLGDIPIENTFTNFLGTSKQGQMGAVNPQLYRTQLGRMAAFLEGDETLEHGQPEVWKALLGSPAQQAGMIFAGLRPDIPYEFRAGAEGTGQKRLQKAWDVANILGAMGVAGPVVNPFREYFQQGTSFAGPSTSQYAGAMGQLADILGPTAPGNLSSAAQGLREEFMEDPEKQWDIAWDIRSRDIPPQLRSGAEGG